MASVSTAGEAIARIAYLLSDTVISVQPALHLESEFSKTLRQLSDVQVQNLVANRATEVLPFRENTDPLLSAFEPIRLGRLVSVTSGSSILLSSIPHLYKLAQHPVVIHVALGPSSYADYSAITSIRQCGFTFLQSETLQQTQDIALSAHALAIKSGKGVIHFYDPANVALDTPVKQEDADFIRKVIDREAIQNVRSPQAGDAAYYVDDGKAATLTEAPLVSNLQKQPVPSQTSRDDASPQKHEGPSATTSAKQSASDNQSTLPSTTSVESTVTRPVSSQDIYQFLVDIWKTIATITGRIYNAFEYTGPEDATSALFIFGSTGVFVDQLMNDPADGLKNLGIITARLYRPWSGAELLKAIPSTIKRIGVLEQLRSKTTKWGPVLLDLLSTVNVGPAAGGRILIVGYQLEYVESSTALQALKGVFQNLNSPSPVQNLKIGRENVTAPAESASTLEQPQVESAYLKVLDQVFKERLFFVNRIEASDAGVSNTISASPEYGFGSLLARIDRERGFVSEVQNAVKEKNELTESARDLLSKWSLNVENPQVANTLAPKVIKCLETDKSDLASQFLGLKSFFLGESRWLIGSEAWSYDLGNSGVHHVLASDANVNMLIIDSQPYSERAAKDSTRRKKDIGLYAMNFGNAYVASVAVYGSYTQVLEAMIEADKFKGPSVVLAYLPYNKENDSPLTVLQETKKAIDLGYWPLYRWNPENEDHGSPNFTLDSIRIKRELESFLKRENQLTQLIRRHPKFSKALSESYGTEVRAAQKRKAKDAYSKLLEGLFGAPMTVLFASDNGNAENLAKRLANRAKGRGLKAMVMAMDDYPLEDISTEENLICITSTAGQGEFPQNGRAFWDAIKDAGDIDLSSVNFSIFGLGDSEYWPRKEEKIYYNKPCKDLDARLAFLGGKRLTNVGLGDDQDPDGFQTGYQEWEPKLWVALGVDKVEGVPDEPPPMTNEDMKAQSNYLRGTIVEGLNDETTGAIRPSDQQLTKFHGIYMEDDRDLREERKAQGLEPAYQFMIRVRVPGGVATPEQWLKMDAISSAYGNETMKLTTRQTFQFHGVIKGNLRPAMRAINKALMTTIAACGDINRNVMCSTLPEHSSFHRDVYKVAQQVNDTLLPSTTAYHEIWLQDEKNKKVKVAGDAVVDYEPLYGPTYLPRKFKVTIAVPPHNDTDSFAHCVGLIAIKGPDGRLEGFNLTAGGGMGVTHNNKKTYPRTGSMLGFVAASDVPEVCKQMMIIQRDNGDRNNRKHARLKYTIEDMGVEVFKKKVEDAIGFKFQEPRPYHFEKNTDTFGWQKDENGKNHFTFFVENGRVEDTPDFPMRTGFRELAKLNIGEFRLTPNQHAMISNIDDADVPRVEQIMHKYKLDNLRYSGLRLSSSSCVAFPTCGLAMAESERYLPVLISKLEHCLEENGLGQTSIVMRMTGCPNGCSRPWLAEVAFVGKAYGAYNMYLGGGYYGQRLNKLYRSSIKEPEILDIMKSLLKRYAIEREEGEHFGDWTIRAKIIKPTLEGRFFHDDVAVEDDE